MRTSLQQPVAEINEIDALLKVQKFINYFKDKNLKDDAIWEAFKSRLNVSGTAKGWILVKVKV